jgi:Reverse transcriptase (RNA-dependent DNA polymerase)
MTSNILIMINIDIFLLDQHIRTGPMRSFSLHESQHAYQRSRSCETALHGIVSKIFAFGTFLDIGGAFDNASHHHGVDGTSTKWIDSMLKNRTARAQVRCVSSVMEIRKGSSQGGVLSPLPGSGKLAIASTEIPRFRLLQS